MGVLLLDGGQSWVLEAVEPVITPQSISEDPGLVEVTLPRVP